MTRQNYIPTSSATYLTYYRGGQHGGTLPFYTGTVYPIHQRGAGIGSVFAKIFSTLKNLFARTPQWVKTGAKMAAKQAYKTGMDIASDAVQPGITKEEWQERAKQRLKTGTGELVGAVGEKMQGKGIKRKRKRQRSTIASRQQQQQQQQQQSKKRKKRKSPRTKRDFFGE